MKKCLFLLTFFVSAAAHSQTSQVPDSISYIYAYQAGHLLKAKQILLAEIASGNSDQDAIYNLACMYSMLRIPDSSFYYLRIYQALNPDFMQALSDPDFYYLMGDKRWAEMEALFSKKYFSDYPLLNKPLVLKLSRMKLRDQAFYYHIHILEGMMGSNNESVRNYWRIKDSLNKANLKELKIIIAKSGWPKTSVAGEIGALTAFLVVQHSDLVTMEEYIPSIEKAAKENEARWMDYAMMSDRILVNKGKKQVYGTQVDPRIRAPFPIEDEKNVDKRRNEKGMGPLSDYLSRMGIKYELPK